MSVVKADFQSTDALVDSSRGDSDPRSTPALHSGEAKSIADLTILVLGATWLAYVGTAVSVASNGTRPFGRTFGMLFLLSVVVITVPVAWPVLEHSWR